MLTRNTFKFRFEPIFGASHDLKLELERADSLSQLVDFGCLSLALTRKDLQSAIQLKNLLFEFMHGFSVFGCTNSTVDSILLVGIVARVGEIFVC